MSRLAGLQDQYSQEVDQTTFHPHRIESTHTSPSSSLENRDFVFTSSKSLVLEESGADTFLAEDTAAAWLDEELLDSPFG